MIIGHGIDIVDVERFGKQLEKAPSLRERLFVPAERALNVRSLAARFAAKEAVAKALGAPAGMNWQDVWIAVTAHGTPYIEVKNTVAAEAERQGVGQWYLSISHDGNNAIASVIAEQ